jgi:ABC-type branched-subunit amino acid transport system ATPase component
LAEHGVAEHSAAELEVRDLTKSFGGLMVVAGLSFVVEKSTIVSLIGPNGAGKSSTLNLLTGVNVPDSGELLFRGRSLLGLQPHEIAAAGVARTFQTLRLFLNMSVIENVMAAAYCHTKASFLPTILRTPGWRREEDRIRALAEEKLAFFGERLKGYRYDQPAYSLSYANRRRLEIARAMATGATTLLLDEPAAGMNPKETVEIAELIEHLRTEGGYTILLVEHDMSVVGRISDRVIVLDHGEKIAEGPYEAVIQDERVIDAYLGRQQN